MDDVSICVLFFETIHTACYELTHRIFVRHYLGYDIESSVFHMLRTWRVYWYPGIIFIRANTITSHDYLCDISAFPHDREIRSLHDREYHVDIYEIHDTIYTYTVNVFV